MYTIERGYQRFLLLLLLLLLILDAAHEVFGKRVVDLLGVREVEVSHQLHELGHGLVHPGVKLLLLPDGAAPVPLVVVRPAVELRLFHAHQTRLLFDTHLEKASLEVETA